MFKEKRKDGTVRLTGSALAAYPVGSIYMSMEATNPQTLFGGAWVRLASGRMLIGIDENDVDFNSPGDIGGAKTHTLTQAEMPSHTHGAGTYDTSSDGNHSHEIGVTSNSGGGGNAVRGQVNGSAGHTNIPAAIIANGAHTHDVQGLSGSNGSDGAHNNMPPYLAVYIWKRNA